MRQQAPGPAMPSAFAIVGWLAFVEFTSGCLQGFYVPLYPDIAARTGIGDADLNWYEAAQLLVCALSLPSLSRLGDLIGHRTVLLGVTAVSAAACWWAVLADNFWGFLLAWGMLGFSAVWLPMEIAILHHRSAAHPQRIRWGTSILVMALELGIVLFAVVSGIIAATLPMWLVLSVPALLTTLCFFVILFGVPGQAVVQASSGFDWLGLCWLSVAITSLMASLALVRVRGPLHPSVMVLALICLASVAWFVRLEGRRANPLLDLRVVLAPGQWPLQLASALLGISILGAQIPMSTYIRADPSVVGYGLGGNAASVSAVIGSYVLAMMVGALCFPTAARLVGDQGALLVAFASICAGWGLMVAQHSSLTATLTCMMIDGLGAGLLMAGLPATAALMAPATHTGMATGLTNTCKTLGGAVASCLFALCLSLDASGSPSGASLNGYLWVWGICAGSGLLAILVLLATRRPGRRPATVPALETSEVAA